MKIEGRTKKNARRVLECVCDGDELHLWIHSPKSKDDGWDIWIPAKAVRDAVWSAICPNCEQR